MEVTMFHPDNKDAKVLVTNEQQYAGYKKMGFVDAPENEEKSANDNVSKTVQEDAREHVKVDPLAAETKAQNDTAPNRDNEHKNAEPGKRVEVKPGAHPESKASTERKENK